MLQWYEGEVLEVVEPIPGDPQHYRMSVRELTTGTKITDVQLHLKDNFMELPPEGTIIAFYRDTAATAKFGFVLSDPRPIGSPIAIETAIKAAKDGELTFQKGEIALGALGEKGFFLPVKGARLWLRNTGDGCLFSGSYQQRITVSDSSDSIDIEGTNIDIYTHGNFLATHAINIDSDAIGLTTMTLGLKNPTTGIFFSHLKSDTLGGWSLGTPEPTGIINDVLAGFTYNPFNLFPPGPMCKMTSISEPLTGSIGSQISVHTFGTTINGATITLEGLKAAVGIPATPAALIQTSAVATVVNTLKAPGLVSIFGTVTKITSPVISLSGGAIFIGGVVPATPSLISLSGVTQITGFLPAVPCLSIGSLVFPVLITPAANPILAAAGVKGIPIFVNGALSQLLII